VQKCKSAFGLCKGAKVEGIFGSQVSALGRVERPHSTAADQGWSALPRDRGVL